MAQTVNPPTTHAAQTLIDLVDRALRARGRLSIDDAVGLLGPLPAALAAAQQAPTPPALPTGTPADVRAVLAALELVPADGTSAGQPPPFRAPELAPGRRATASSDVYTIAGLLRTAITGDAPPPWTLETLPSGAGRARLGGAFGDLLWDALADEPERRPPTVDALLDRAITAIAPDATAPAAPDLPELRVLLLGAALAAAFLLGSVFALTGGDDKPAKPDPIEGVLPAPATSSVADRAYAEDAADTMRRLNERRVIRRLRLRDTGTAAGQSQQATELADAYGLAARSMGRAPAPPRAAAANAAITEAMLLTESAYRTIARAARDGDRPQFVGGRDAVGRREALLQRRIQRLEQLGFSVG